MSFCSSEKARIIMKEVKKLDLNLTEEQEFRLRIAISDGIDEVEKTQIEYDRL